MDTGVWRKCGPCKKEITYKANYYKCSASSCHKHAFCSKDCWSIHNSMMRHKEAWPEEEIAPAHGELETSKNRRIVNTTQSTQIPQNEDLPLDSDILIVASKLKAYIKAKSSMNTSASVMNRLSEMVRKACDRAIENATKDGRKTVMDRDFF